VRFGGVSYGRQGGGVRRLGAHDLHLVEDDRRGKIRSNTFLKEVSVR
jgi:hypothetical protein